MKTKTNLMEKPIFLVGAERSGTTVLRLMLDSHPQLAWLNEFEYAVDLIDREGNYPNLANYSEWLETHRIFQATGFTIDRTLDYPQLVNSFLCQKLNREDKPLVGATVHRHFNKLLNIWPDARFIHIVRDGRDVARSCIGMGWAGNVWTGVKRWQEAESLWKQVEQQISSDRYINVVYEELISDPVDVLKQICNFIGLEYNEAMLNYHQKTTYDFPDPKFIAQWQHKLSPNQIQLVESRISSMLTEREYKLSGLPLIKVNYFQEKLLKLQDWWTRVQFRIKKAGFALFISDYLSRHFGLEKWQKSIKFKLNAIDTLYLK